MTADVLNSEVKHDTRRESYHINNPNQTTISSEGTLSSARWMLDHPYICARFYWHCAVTWVENRGVLKED